MRKSCALILITLSLAACGDDPPPPPPPRPAATAAKPAAKPGGAAAKKGGTDTSTLRVYRKVEDVVTDKERPDIRHGFRERDFSPDPTGTENRDPFRSFVITQPGVGVTEPGIAVEATDVCPIKKQIARGYGVRELRLIGIVSQGTTRYALFSDTRGEGRIVHRGDCLGKEKARVKEIGAGFVTLELSPEPVPNQPPRAPEERSIPLYPKELPLGEDDGADEPARPARPTVDPGPATPAVPPDGANRQ